MAVSPRGKTRAPDGGYGWVVVVFAFFITFFTYGIFYSIGILFDVLMEDFECSDSEITVVASIAFSFQCLLGPLVSPIQHHCTYRFVISTGVLFCSTSLISSAFAPTVFSLYFTFGVLGGIGMALVYLPLNVIMPFYFDKRRGTAMSIGFMGSFAGCFVFPFIIRYLEIEYGWRGALFILGAIQLNSFIGCLFMVPVDSCICWKSFSTINSSPSSSDVEQGKTIEDKESSANLLNLVESNVSAANDPGQQDMGDEKMEEMQQDYGYSFNEARAQRSISAMSPSAFYRSKPQGDNVSSLLRTALVGSPHVTSVTHAKSPLYVGRFGTRSKEANADMVRSHLFNLNHSHGNIGGIDNRFVKSIDLTRITTPKPRRHTHTHKHSHPHLHLTSLDGGLYGGGFSLVASRLALDDASSVTGLFSRQISQATAGDFLDNVNEDSENSSSTQRSNSKNSCDSLEREVGSISIWNFGFLRNWKFYAIVIASFLKAVILHAPSLFIVSYSLSIGFSESQATFLMALVGIGNVIGRPLTAMFSDKFQNRRIELSSALMAVAGAVTATTTLLPVFYYQIFFVMLFAFVVGGVQTQQAPVIADMMVDMNELVFALGITLGIEGLGYLVGPPLLSLFSTYTLIFGAIGLVMLLMALIFASVAVAGCMCRKRRRHKVAKLDSWSDESSTPSRFLNTT